MPGALSERAQAAREHADEHDREIARRRIARLLHLALLPTLPTLRREKDSLVVTPRRLLGVLVTTVTDSIELVIIIHLPQEASDAPLRKKRQANDLQRCFTCDCCCSQSFLLLADGAADAIEEVLTARQESFKFMNHPAIECQ